MKLFVTLAAYVGMASAALSSDYLRDLMTEKTVRSFAKDPTTGQFRCEPGFTGSDCSQKKCPYSMAFATSDIDADWLYTPSTATAKKTKFGPTTETGAVQVQKDTTFDNQHAYMECGGRGLCDRSTGQCKCFASFTGEGCRRTTCPNDCSGHGQCRTDANSFYYLGRNPTSNMYGSQIPDYSKTPGSSTWGIHTSWLKYQQCHCDAGYEGDDCSLRMCPKGDDPETECSTDLGNDKQKIECTFAPTAADASKFHTKAYMNIRFTDQFNGVYDTRPIKIDTTPTTGLTTTENANSIQDALEALPNFAIPQVEVDFSVSGKKVTVEVEFTDGHNTGKQPLLHVFRTAKCEDGAQPKFESVVASGDFASCTVSRIAVTGGDYKEHATCSNRGICDQSTGLCNCFDGYFGDACDHVNTYI